MFLLDGNLLIALVVADHVHHDVAVAWFVENEPTVVTCPITQGTLIRFLVREGHSSSDAAETLDTITAAEWHLFRPDAIAYDRAMLTGVIGHRQVTDSYLVALARHLGIGLATLDRGLHLLHGEPVHLIPT